MGGESSVGGEYSAYLKKMRNKATIVLCLTLYSILIFVFTQYRSIMRFVVKPIQTALNGFVTTHICSPPQTEDVIQMQLGRLDHVFPSPRCCNSSFSCSPGSRSRTHSSSSISNAGRGKSSRHHRRPNIVLTALRNDFYLPLVKSLVCTFRISNPGIEFAVATVDGDLNSTSIQTIREELNLKIFYWSDIQFVNKKSPRFALNWVRIRAWEMEQYESILLVDADTVILGDIRHLFALPTAFATVLDQDKTSPKFSSLGRMQGGVILLRPCAAVADHMISLLDQHEYLRFTHGHAEQSFFDWYFRHERWILPTTYNAIGHLLNETTLLTAAGLQPIIVHFTRFKPFLATPSVHKDHKYAICQQPSEPLLSSKTLTGNGVVVSKSNPPSLHFKGSLK